MFVKCSNSAAGSGAGINGEQMDFTEFHLGQGEDGKEDSLTDLLFPALSSQKSADWKIPNTIAIFLVLGKNRHQVPGSRSNTQNCDSSPVCQSGIYSEKQTWSPPIPLR